MSWDDKINEVMDHFDFRKVADTLKAVDWRWVIPNSEEYRVPTEPEIRAEARRLMVKLGRSDTRTVAIGTGGLEAFMGGDDTLGLRFIVAEWVETGD